MRTVDSPDATSILEDLADRTDTRAIEWAYVRNSTYTVSVGVSGHADLEHALGVFRVEIEHDYSRDRGGPLVHVFDPGLYLEALGPEERDRVLADLASEIEINLGDR